MTTRSRSRASLALDILNHGALGLVALLFLFPFFWMVSNAVRSNAEVMAIPVRILPTAFQWDNFAKAWIQLPFGRFFINSLFVSLSVTVITVVISCLSGYAFARLKFPGREALLVTYLGTLMVPAIMLIIPLYLIVNSLGMVNTFQGVILPVAFGTFGAFLMRQFFLSIPMELEEAARVDGASRLRILVSIIVPLSMPAIGLLSLFTFIAQWNNFLWPLITTTKPDMQVAIVALATLQCQYNTDWPLLMTGSVIAIVPVLLVFVFGYRAFIAGLTTGAFGGR